MSLSQSPKSACHSTFRRPKIYLEPRTDSPSHLHTEQSNATAHDAYLRGSNQREREREALAPAGFGQRGKQTSGVAWPGRVPPNGSAMAASPNSAHSSSAATPDGLFDEATDNTGCTHISALLADSADRDPVLNRFRRVVTWKTQRTHEALHPAKRRKVRFVHLPRCPVYV